MGKTATSDLIPIGRNPRINSDIVHSAAAGFDHSAEIWPRVKNALDEAFKPPSEKLRDVIDSALIDANYDGVVADPAAVQHHQSAALVAFRMNLIAPAQRQGLLNR